MNKEGECPLHAINEFVEALKEITGDAYAEVRFAYNNGVYMTVTWRSQRMGLLPIHVTKSFDDLYHYNYKTLNDILLYIKRIEDGV